MRQLYLDLKYTSEVPDAYRMSAIELSQASGNNMGNFAFRHALQFLLEDLHLFTPVRWPEFSQIAQKEKVGNVVVSCANWLGLSEQDESSNLNRAKAIELVECNVVSFGLGVQAKLTETLPKLGPNTERLAKTLAERAKLLSVRDVLTQDTLEAIGINNTVVTGCPSNFINSDPQLGASIVQRAGKFVRRDLTWADLRSCISEASGGHPLSGKLISNTLKMLAETPAFYVVQSPALLPFMIEDRNQIPGSYRSNNPFEDDRTLERVLKAKTLHFSHMDSWMDFGRTCDIGFGMRIHGTMLPLQAGLPSVLVAHDTRTIGLAEKMGIPWVSPEDFARIYISQPGALFSVIVEQMKAYDAHRKELATVMMDYIKTNELAPHNSLQRLIA